MSHHTEENQLTHSLERLSHELSSLAGVIALSSTQPSLHLIMSTITDFVTAQNAFNDRLDASIAGLQGDIKFLTDKITELQNSPGVLTPADQASLDALQARTVGIADKLAALDALTAPVPPAV